MRTQGTLLTLALLISCAETRPTVQRHADYMILTREEFVPALQPLVELRKGLGVRIETPRDRDPSKIRDLVRAAAPRFVLLAGDTDTLPEFRMPSPIDMFEPDVATDAPYGDMEIPVGRLPAATSEQLQAMVQKIVAYETRSPPGAWRRKLCLVAEPGGFGRGADEAIEKAAGALLAEEVPYSFDVNVTYANPKSAYFFPPKQFNEHVIDLMNRGALFLLYAGHGSSDAFSSFWFEGEQVPILRRSDVPRLHCAGGLPIVFALACNTGQYELPECIGEALVRHPAGPVAFIGSSRISHPYGDSLFAFEMVQALVKEPDLTLGEIIVRAKKTLVGPSTTRFRKQADALVQMFDSKMPRDKARLRAAWAYNLLGDPALRPATTPQSVEIQIDPSELAITGKVPNVSSGEVVVELLCDRRALGNDKSCVKAQGVVVNGAFRVALSVPADLPKAKAYYARALVTAGEREVMGVCPVPKERLK